jgi:hypothetical protein
MPTLNGPDRPRLFPDGDGKEDRAMKKAKTDKRSVPPPKQKMKKKKLDAKMTKPRRRKIDSESR